MKGSLVLTVALLSSCGAWRGCFDVLQGNYQYGRGMYQEAIVSYLKAADSLENDDDGYRAWVEYNLGNAYHSLGESASALSVWEKAEETGSRELLFHIAYNKGSLYYELGRYDEARAAFKQALKLDPSALDAKINLELSLRKLASGGAAGLRPGYGVETSGEDAARIFDYVKRKDATRWTAAEEIAGSGGDDW